MDQDKVVTKPSGEFDDLNPYAAPQLDLSFNLSSDHQQELAGRLRRLAATFLDGLFGLIMMLILVLGGIAASTMPAFHGDRMINFWVIILLAFGVGFLLLGIYAVVQLVLIARHGQTLGKRIMKIRVVRTGTAEKCGLGRYFWLRGVVTWLLGGIPLVGFLVAFADPLMIFREDRRCLHDHIADTEVVKV